MGNRNNKGSLFHQLINAPGLMVRQDLSQSVSFQTRENYFNWGHKAASEFKCSAGKGRGDGGKPAELNKFLGLREGDLKRLRGDSLIYKNGHCYVIVDKCKGGKYQEQRVCDKDIADVQKFFDGSHRKLFIARDFGRDFDYRGHLEPLGFFDKPYVLRGKNKELAIKQGRPRILDRLALRAASVLHLAHWRDNVTVQSYLARRQ